MGRPGGEAKRERKVSPGVQNDAKKGPKMRSGGPKSDKKGVRGALGDPEKTGPGKVAEKKCFGEGRGCQNGAKIKPNSGKNASKKKLRKQRRFCSVLDHFLGRFGSLFGTESGPKTSADRFSDKKSDSEQALVITMDLKDFTGPKRPEKRLWG